MDSKCRAQLHMSKVNVFEHSVGLEGLVVNSNRLRPGSNLTSKLFSYFQSSRLRLWSSSKKSKFEHGHAVWQPAHGNA